ncbi:hypothetical protein BGZ83_003979 [Gryganskiella cystojenkinii]|nr:hypothetical protein BGZ83_003979 [Gryganskiella cystojenkinii]
MHYRKQLEIFSTVIHHIIYYFIVIHMRAGDMLSVFCICGTPIEASSIFLSYGRMFPARRTKIVEMLYVICFVSTRLIYVSLLWHEVYFNYPDKSVSFLYTITLSLHVYWFVLYLKTQKRFKARQRRQHLCAVLESLASSVREEISVLETSRLAIKENLCFTNSTRTTYTTTTYVRRKLESSELDFSPVHSPTVMAKSVSAGPSHLLDWRKLQQLQQPKKDLLLDETGLPFDEHENMGSIDEQVASRGNQYGDVLLPLLSRNVSSGRGRSSQSEIYVNQI